MKSVKQLIFLSILATAALTVQAQDIITLKNGDEIKAKVSKVGTSEIEYKKFDNQSGPAYTISVAEIFMIKYPNGSKDVFNASASGGGSAAKSGSSAALPPPTSNTPEFSAADVFSGSQKLTWIGLDFTKAKFIGDFAQGFGVAPASPEQIKGTYMPAWNMLVINESDKYNIPATFSNTKISVDINPMQKYNNQTDIEEMISYNDPNYADENIREFVQTYPYTGSGIGIGFVVESFNKTTGIATFHFVAVDFASRKAIVIEKVTGKPSGFGVRNYWAGAFAETLKNTKKNWSTWRGKY